MNNLGKWQGNKTVYFFEIFLKFSIEVVSRGVLGVQPGDVVQNIFSRDDPLQLTVAQNKALTDTQFLKYLKK